MRCRASIFVCLSVAFFSQASFALQNHQPRPSHADNVKTQGIRRDQFCSYLVAASGASVVSCSPNRANAENDDGVTVYKNPSGLKYVEIKTGTGPSPEYGQLCAIEYTGYLKLPTEDKPQKFDSNDFLIKHGNGRIIAGLDEGIHTMKVGGKRRLIIPPKLGYVESGLGPIPELPWNRWSLNRLLGQMIEQRGGNLVFEVELKSAMDDEASQGYYEDASPTPEELERLRTKFQERADQLEGSDSA
ncbi:FK506-binding protein 4 [Seminavis robusta]|uniref:peptidylprolyl isomerase n=1 Tax=Seminavis robusta TaxID=568900 RepID=A0A9N8DFM0_9STRA|nr:FK506-binding protein 4 [Seminavis robusta]|eukprot:Sro69_g038490.1 FK506-binding protein 4 (245) ;mRNA; r:36240-36974